MITRIPRTVLAALLLLTTFNFELSTLFAQGTAFTYQGQLKDGPGPANGSYDLTFSVFSVTTGGSPSAGSLTNSAVAVSNGLFTTLLDFGDDLFDGPGPVLLEIAVRPSGDVTFITLNPRQLVTPVPHSISSSLAFQAVNASNVANGAAVTRLNNLSDNVTLAAGANVTITPSGNTLTIGASGINPWQLNGSSTFYNAGRVGIGTTNPSTPLHIATAADPIMILQDTGSASQQTGYIGFWNATPTETGWLGFGTPGSPHFSIVNARSTGNINLFPGSGGGSVVVDGTLRLGATSQLFATGGEENLRIIRGTIAADGTKIRGSGFTSSRPGDGDYLITFTTPFAATPTVTASLEYRESVYPLLARPDNLSAGSANIVLNYWIPGEDAQRFLNDEFHFIAVGPR